MGYKSLLETQTITVIQPAIEIFQDMEWVEGIAPDPFDIKVNLQPFRMSPRRVVPEGYRIEDLVLVISKSYKLKSSSVYTKQTADRFIYREYIYEVLSEQDWTDYGMSTDHFACLAVKKEPYRVPLEDLE